MKEFKPRLIVLFLFIIAFSSCRKDEKVSNKKTVQLKTKENTAEINPTAILFSFENEDKTEIIKISGSEPADDDKFSLISDKNSIVVSKYRKNKAALQLIVSDTLLVSEYNIVSIDSQNILRKKIQGTEYFFFSYKESPMGNGDPGLYLSFIMLDINTLKSYKLQYIGEYTLRSDELVDGEFIEDRKLDSKPKIKKELYQFAQKCKWIYSPSGQEKDINYYKNFEQKWHLDNKEDSSLKVIKSTYYTEDLFQFNGNYDKDDLIENDDFKVVTYFSHNIIGYDKNKELYFPVIVESCVHGCYKEIEFLSENKILITRDTNIEQTDTIDLDEIKFTNELR